ncbi:MAG: hypothetical protein ACFFFH_20955 [Candidatus Thorarchaeota archaeon]
MDKHIVTQLKLKINKIYSKKRGVSPVLATVIIFGLIITGVMITYVQVVPYIQQAQSEEAITTTSNSFLELDTAIKSLISESGTPGGFRTVIFNKPAGRIEYDPFRYYYRLRLLDQNENLVYNILEEIADEKESGSNGFLPIGVLDWIYNSPQAVIPRGTTKYLTGPDPYKIRDPVFLTGAFSSTDYLDLTNLTLSHLDDRRHHIALNYRMSIYLTISTQPEPEIRFEIFLILISADFEAIRSQYEHVTIHSQNTYSVPYTLSKNESIGDIELVWDDFKSATTTSLWSTHTIQGFNLKYFNIVVQTLVYEVGLSTS